MQSNCQKSSRLTKFATIDEEEPHDIRRACLSEASRRPLVGIVNTRREQLLELDTLFYREDKEDNKNKDNSKVVKPKTKSSAEADICANTIQTLWPQTVIGSRAQPVPLPVPLYVPVPVKVPLPVPVPTKEDPSLDEDAVEQRQKKGMIARGLTKLDKIRKSISLPNIGSGAASVWHESRPIASTADKQKGSQHSIQRYHLNPSFSKTMFFIHCRKGWGGQVNPLCKFFYGRFSTYKDSSLLYFRGGGR